LIPGAISLSRRHQFAAAADDKNFRRGGARPLHNGERSRASVGAADWTKVGLLRLIGVNGMRDENAGAEKSHQYCCNLNHGTHPLRSARTDQYQPIAPGLFPDDFVVPSKWFRRLFPSVPPPLRRHTGHKFFIPASWPAGDANPTKSADVSRRRWHGLTSVISSLTQGPIRTLEKEHG
jgi:hypothetical protein